MRQTEMERGVAKRIQAGWTNWRDISGVHCDRRMPVKLKGKVYRTVVRPAMIYGLETVPMKKSSEKKMEVTEMRIFRGRLELQGRRELEMK